MMEDTIRLFTGLAVPESIRRRLQSRLPEWQRRFRFAKWAHPQDWHITLHFIGEMPAGRLTAVCEALDAAARAASPVPIDVQGLDVFGPPRAPSILHVKLVETPEALSRLHAELGRTLAGGIGFEPERRAYRPHITMARKYAGDERWDPAWTEDDPFAASWTAAVACVFRSRLGRSPMYEIVHRSPLVE